MAKGRNLGILSPKGDVSIRSLSSWLRKLCGRQDGKIVRARGDEGHQRNKTDAHTNSQRLWACIGLSWMGYEPGDGSEHDRSSLINKLSPVENGLHWVNKRHFFGGLLYKSRWSTQNKLNASSGDYFFVSQCFVWAWFKFYSYLLICYSFCFDFVFLVLF